MWPELVSTRYRTLGSIFVQLLPVNPRLENKKEIHIESAEDDQEKEEQHTR